MIFLSTHSVRSATASVGMSDIGSSIFLSTHSVRSATERLARGGSRYTISIHALRKECDLLSFVRSMLKVLFLSTHSVRSATNRPGIGGKWLEISIHALRKECDSLKENVTMLYAHSHFFANRYFLYQILYSFQTK